MVSAACETDQERAAMVSSSEFAVVARFFPQGGGTADIEVIFDDPFLRSEIGLAAVSSRTYSLTTLESWLATAGDGQRDDEVEVPVGGARYRVLEKRPRQGLVDVELELA